jgi:CheY-like chemotaxis protein/CBS domain-containing protein
MLRQEEYEFRLAPSAARVMRETQLCTIEPREPIAAAEQLMRQRQLRHVLVMKDEHLLGLLSERDLLERAPPRIDDAPSIEVRRLMTSRLETTTADTDAASAAELLLRRGIGALPVLAEGRVVGVITKSDFLRYVVAAQSAVPAGQIADEHSAKLLGPVQTVLVVEDDAAILSSLAEVIREDGYVVDTAANGRQAMARLEACEPDLIFLDLMMPQLDGWEFLAKVRAQRTTRPVPIVLISALPNLAKEAQKLGISRFLQKPFELESVTQITRACCRVDQEAG